MPKRIFAAALAFGMLAALVKGNHEGLRDTIGNLSTPWLLVAFLPALAAPSVRRGALVGLAATVTALLGFYLVVAISTDDQLPTLQEHLEHVLRKNRLWLWSGLISGPVMGAFGAWVGKRAALLVIGLLLILEPIVIYGARIVPGWRHVIHWTLEPGPYLVEAALGVVLLTRLALRNKETSWRSAAR
ncbi:hypothetical protein FB565_006879 [Actinoplanes lutulentus]|uniref:Uncharacterized protein n=1 Tax=Actinoplanes lutulentus TaxID=1287878 RepID=A0A327Z4E5_9ACTN|nr:DUF6518 family protein [Actinoplanes lutulentus]MBB2947111.1 hypothetical protein [Actinoplanes lutulentus]RAK30607.1 hypothetical protein B0I29_116266 [Actinoplanes lutulentus]